MSKRVKKPKRRIPLPKKTEKVHRDKSKYTRKDKYKKGDEEAEPSSN
jgi:hypothetical protein